MKKKCCDRSDPCFFRLLKNILAGLVCGALTLPAEAVAGVKCGNLGWQTCKMVTRNTQTQWNHGETSCESQ